MKQLTLLVGFVITLALGSSAVAGTSLKMGSVFIGFDQVRSGQPGYSPMDDLIRGYARQIGHSCFSTEVMFRDTSSSILTAKLYYDTGLPSGASERVLLDSFDQRVAMVSRRIGGDVLTVLARWGGGVLLGIC